MPDFFFFVSHFVVFYLYEASTFDICSSFLLLKLSLSSCLYPLYQLSLTFEFPFDSHDPHSQILPFSHVPYHFMTHFSIIFFPLQCLSCIGLSRFYRHFSFPCYSSRSSHPTSHTLIYYISLTYLTRVLSSPPLS